MFVGFYFYTRKKDQDHYIATRCILRAILADYLNADPDQLQFSHNAYGKPTLSDSSLHFNLSHSGDVALYAFTQNRGIGIDVEKIRTDLKIQEIAERFFTPKENAFIQLPPDDKKYEAFFSIWTRKEAYIKGEGKGLSISLDSFDVSDIEKKTSKIINVELDSNKTLSWLFTELNPAPGYTATLAVEGVDWKLSCWKW